MPEAQAYEHSSGESRQRVPVKYENSSQPKYFNVYQVATYDACAFRMSTTGTLPTGTPLDMRMAASPA